MKKLLSLLTVLSLSAWMVGCAPESTPAPETTGGADPTTEMHDDYVEGGAADDAAGGAAEHADAGATEAAPAEGDAPPAEGAPEGGSAN